RRALDYAIDGAVVTVGGILDEDTYRDSALAIAAVFRAGAAHGGKGVLVMLWLDDQRATTVTIDRRGSRCAEVDEKPAWRPRVQELLADANRRFDATP